MDDTDYVDDPKLIARAIGVTLRQIRERRGLTRTELAKLAGVSIRSLIALERGTISPAAALEIARRAKCSMVRPAPETGRASARRRPPQ